MNQDPIQTGPCGTPGGPLRLSSLAASPGMAQVRLVANRHPGACHRCGAHLAAGAGYVERSGGRWLLFC